MVERNIDARQPLNRRRLEIMAQLHLQRYRRNQVILGGRRDRERDGRLGPIFAGQDQRRRFPLALVGRPAQPLISPALYRPKRNGTEVLCCLESENRSVACLDLVAYYIKGEMSQDKHNSRMLGLFLLKKADLLYILEKCTNEEKFRDYLEMNQRELYRRVWTLFQKKRWRINKAKLQNGQLQADANANDISLVENP